MRVPIAVAILLAGCFSKPPFNGDGGTDDGGGSDAKHDARPDAGPCTGTFSALVPILPTNGLVTGEPTIAGNLLELYWSHQNGRWLIERASRTTTSGTWAINAALDFVPNNIIDADPSVTSDGTLMIMRVESGGKPLFVQSTKSGATWSGVSSVQGLESVQPASLDLSGDGLTLYYNDMSNNLRVATRHDRTMPFADSGDSFGSGFAFPAVSADGLQMFYTNGIGGTSRATRPTTTDAFTSVGEEFAEYKDPDLTEDGTTLVVAKDQKIHIATRTCP